MTPPNWETTNSRREREPASAKAPGVFGLADAGVVIDTSSLSGLCGTCKVRYLSGEPDHRDHILSDEEKKS